MTKHLPDRVRSELNQGPRIPAISDFLDGQLSRLSAAHEMPAPTRDPAPLDALFIAILRETYGDRIGQASGIIY
jgi:hypothetical protein